MEISDIFEEWDTYSKSREFKSREFDLNALIDNSERKIVAITGIRRCGKSSIMMLLRQKFNKNGAKACYVNLEDSRIRSQKDALDSLLKWFGDDEGYMLLDEITAIPGWEGWLARVHEQLKGKLKLIVTSSRKSLSSPKKELRGRIVQFELYPLSFREYLSFSGISPEKTTVGRGKLEKALAEYMKYGGFPEVALTKNNTDKVKYIDSYFTDIIGLDIAEVSHEDINLVETIAKYLLQSKYFSASKCLNLLNSMGYKIGKERILKIEKYIQSGYLFFFLPIFSYGIKDSKQYPRKPYPGDVGFFYGITGKSDIGMPFETLAYLELRRRMNTGSGIAYWKDKTGAEADFVIKHGNEVKYVFQVSYSINEQSTKTRELLGAVTAAKTFKLKHATILTAGNDFVEVHDGITVKVLNIVDWLQQDLRY